MRNLNEYYNMNHDRLVCGKTELLNFCEGERFLAEPSDSNGAPHVVHSTCNIIIYLSYTTMYNTPLGWMFCPNMT